MLSLSLGVRRDPDTKAGFSSVPAKRRAQQEKTLERDKNTCRCCGFRAGQYQRVVPVDGELVTLCLFCEQVLALDEVGMSGSGALIWLPEISQADLNHLARAIYVARASTGTPLAAAATRALDALMARRADAKRRLGADDPLLLATVFFESLTDEEYKAREAKLEGIRLLPLDKRLMATRNGDVDMFPRVLDFWCSSKGPFAKMPVDKWQEMFASAVAVVNKAPEKSA